MTRALLLMDLQNGLISRFGADGDFLDRVVATQERAEQAGIPVILVRVGFRPGQPEVSPRNKMFTAARARGDLILGTPAVEPNARLQPGHGELVVTKKRASAFSGSDLDAVLRSLDADSLILAGIATSGVVLSTVREAADRDYGLTVLADLCLDADPEVHRVLTEKVFPSQATVVASGEWRP